MKLESVMSETFSKNSKVPEETFDISDLAKEFAISTRTIRFYEEKGIVSPRRSGHTRIFNKRDRARLVLALRGKRLGFSLDEVKKYLELYDVDPSGSTQARHLAGKIDEMLEVLEEKQVDLTETIAELIDLRSQSHARLSDS